MPHIICKFGGTSVSSKDNWNHIFEIVQNHILDNKQPIIVCSALSQASNQLENLIESALLNRHHDGLKKLQKRYQDLASDLAVDDQMIANDFSFLERLLQGVSLLQEASPKTQAAILSLGELMMSRLGEAFLKCKGIDCEWLDAREIIHTMPLANNHELNYLAAQAAGKEEPKLANKLLKTQKQAYITQGFIASNPKKETVLLGRGGSDTSASLLAKILQAEKCEIWTDVPGIYTANPHQLPHARLLKQLNYDEAQEIATMGAKVLHPNCIPPVRMGNIPLAVKYTKIPKHSGTLISHERDNQAPPIKSIQVKHGVTLISIDTLNMWQQVGFLADVFNTFRAHGFSVDLLSSSEFNVTVSLDTNYKYQDQDHLTKLLGDLNAFGKAKLIEPCSAVSLVGHHIRTVLPQLGPSLEVFESQQIHMMSLASNDLNLTFVVDETQAEKLCHKLHGLLIENNPQSFYYSKSWQEEFGQQKEQIKPWWAESRDKLLEIGKHNAPCYVYNIGLLSKIASQLKKVNAIDQFFYAIKANSNKDVLAVLKAHQIGFECVSKQEVEHVQSLFPDIPPKQILFTPNFCGRDEYKYAVEVGCFITVDNMYVLEQWPELFKNQDIILRIDPGSGAGHHKYVCTGGNESKFGIPRSSVESIIKITEKHKIKVIGLHAHSGSGILKPDLWQETARLLCNLAQQFPHVEIINLGGGLGIVEKPGQSPLSLEDLNQSLQAVKTNYPQYQFWMEPGRYFVAESGVIIAKVTQLKEKGDTRFVGIETGMNSLIRPALYGSYHEIVNLSKLDITNTQRVHVVGPICESGDTLGYDRMMPNTAENDFILIANTGAYGYCMGSNYNLRPPAKEIIYKND